RSSRWRSRAGIRSRRCPFSCMHLFKDTKIDFLRWRWQAIALSWAIIIAGAVMFWRVGIPLGIEFAGGTELVMQFDHEVSVDQVPPELDKGLPANGGQNSVVQAFGEAARHEVLIRLPATGGEFGENLGKVGASVQDALVKAGFGNVTRQSADIVGPAVG